MRDIISGKIHRMVFVYTGDKFYLATWSKLAKELMIWTVPPEIEEVSFS